MLYLYLGQYSDCRASNLPLSSIFLKVMISRTEGIRLRRKVVINTHLLGPVLGCLKMTTIDHQHYLETGDIPGVAGMIDSF